MKIFYKITNTLLVLALIPITLFLPFFKLITTSDAVNKYLDSLGIGEQISLASLYNAIMQVKEQIASGTQKLNISLDVLPEDIKNRLITFVVFAGITVFFALAVLVTGLFTKKKLLTSAFSLTGIISAMLMNFNFNKMALPIISGQTDLIGIYSKITGDTSVKTLTDLASGLQNLLKQESQVLNSLFDTLFGGFTKVDVRIFRLSDAYSTIIVIFGTIILFNIFVKMYESSKQSTK